MMLKQLRTLARLAVCLFAIVIVMGGCGNGPGEDEDDNGNGNGNGKELTTMEKLYGTYTLVSKLNRDSGEVQRSPIITGSLSLNSPVLGFGVPLLMGILASHQVFLGVLLKQQSRSSFLTVPYQESCTVGRENVWYWNMTYSLRRGSNAVCNRA